MDKSINWEQRRYELVKSIVQGFLSNSENINAQRDNIINYATSFADAIIEKLKEK